MPLSSVLLGTISAVLKIRVGGFPKQRSVVFDLGLSPNRLRTTALFVSSNLVQFTPLKKTPDIRMKIKSTSLKRNHFSVQAKL